MSGDRAAMLLLVGIVATCLVAELACAIALRCSAASTAGPTSGWLIAYPVLGLVFICVACVSWVRNRSSSRKYSDAVLGNKPDNILSFKVILVVLLTIWSLCLLASFPRWHVWAGAADIVVCCLPLVVIPLLLCGFFLRDAESTLQAPTMWTMPPDGDSPRISRHTEAEKNADSKILPDANVSPVVPAVHSEEVGMDFKF
ncbi:cell surface protein [Anaplasma capra]|uniref:cell surface protein n=1 Tax=Anaplasma capra TaxID=1562740 RepID=UPI0021D5DBB1|nr:cell surface protein [Anaplasma capra]MCU7611887.1 cell surface protein [Anaplasma capra]MCU7612262.1 cell surface protein [Anaplasma capra]